MFQRAYDLWQNVLSKGVFLLNESPGFGFLESLFL